MIILGKINKLEGFFLFFFFFSMNKHHIVVPPKPFPGRDWSRLMFLINNILSLRKIYFFFFFWKFIEESTDTAWIWFCSVMPQRLASDSNNTFRNYSNRSFLSTMSVARVSKCEKFSSSELENSYEVDCLHS